jgi:nitronate monooxygenase
VTQQRKMMLEELQRRNYSQLTAEAYLRAMKGFFKHFHRAPEQLTQDHIREYQAYLFRERKLSSNTVSQHVRAQRPDYKPYSWIRFEDQARVLLDEKVPVFSFICGIPPQEILEECRAKHIVTIGTATTPEEGAALQEAGVDAIVASGFEAGGHRGSFLRAAEDSLTGTFSLVPQIADMVNVPVIAAGGIADARGVIAALALGAEAVQMGTVFLSCEESGASLLHRQALRGKKAGHTALTKGFTGRLARGIHNRLLEELNQAGTAILPYPLQRRLVRNLAIPAEAAGRSDLVPLWAGQSANLSTCTDVLAFLTSLVEEVSEIRAPIIQWSAARRAANS